MERRKFIRNTLITSGSIALAPSLLFGKTNILNVALIAPGSTINAKAAGLKFDHFWSKCVGAGRANEGLRASWLEQLKLARKHCGFEYCRFHGLFHDDMFTKR